MYDKGKVITGIIIFLLIFLSPVLLNLGRGGEVQEPDLAPAREKADHCVEETAWMKKNHMALLNQWRNEVVRENNRVYRSRLDGEAYEMSLSNTCLDCHSNYKSFCNRCHQANEVDLFCWDCHLNFSEEFK